MRNNERCTHYFREAFHSYHMTGPVATDPTFLPASAGIQFYLIQELDDKLLVTVCGPYSTAVRCNSSHCWVIKIYLRPQQPPPTTCSDQIRMQSFRALSYLELLASPYLVEALFSRFEGLRKGGRRIASYPAGPPAILGGVFVMY